MSDARHAIENLMHTYARRIDAGDLEGVADLFRHAKMYGPNGAENGSGYDGVLAIYQGSTRIYPDGSPHTRHVTTNLILELDAAGDKASGQSYFTVFQQVDDFPMQAIIAGRYEDEFEKVDGQWRFASRRMFPEQIGDLSRHLLQDYSNFE